MKRVWIIIASVLMILSTASQAWDGTGMIYGDPTDGYEVVAGEVPVGTVLPMILEDDAGERFLRIAELTEDAEELGTIFENIPVKVLEEGSEWSLVRLGDQIQGFVRNENVQAGGSFENEYSYYAFVGAINQSSQSEGGSMRKLIIG